MKLGSSIVALGVVASLLIPAATRAESHSDRGHLQAKMSITAGKSSQVKSLTGRVTSISGGRLMVLAASGLSYDIDATDAKLDRRYGATMSFSDIQVNDTVEVKGTFATGSTTIIKAKTIRDLSLQARNGEFKGQVTSIGTNSFVLQTANRSMQTINLTNTTIVKVDGATSSFSGITVGATVEVTGVWNTANNNVTAYKILVKTYPLSISFRGNLLQIANDTTLNVRAQNGLTYEVQAKDARITLRNNASSSLGELRVGDMLEIKGKHAYGSTKIMASSIKNLSSPATSTADTRSISVDVVTSASNGKTLGLSTQDLFFLRLDQGYTWTVTTQNQTVVRRIDGGLRLPNMQGLFQATGSGTTDITATGTPLCRQQASPACPTASIQFVLHVNVR